MTISYENPAAPLATLQIAGIGSPWIEQRRNLFTCPQPTQVGLVTDGFRWGTHSAATGTVVLDAEGWARVDASTGTSFGMRSSNFAAAAGFIEPGEFVLSLDVETSAGQAIPAIQYFTYLANGTLVQSGIIVNPQIDTGGRVFYPFTVNAPAVRATFYLHAPKSAAGAWFRARRSQLESGTTPTAYFDGNTNPDGDRRRTRWAGPEGASASILETRVQGEILTASGGTITLDENYSPFVTASVTVPLTSAGIGELIDPRDDQRVTVTASDESLEFLPPRVFDLGIRDRTVDHGRQTITIEAASDEAKLHDTCRLATTTDRSARAYETSLRGIVNWALAKIGAALGPAGPDPDMTAYWQATNRATNGGVRVDATGGAFLDTPIRKAQVTPGEVIAVSVLMASTGAAQPARMLLRFYDADGATILDSYSDPIMTSTSAATPTKVYRTRQVPPGAVSVSAYVNVQTNTAGQNHYVSALMFGENIPFFDGASTDPGYVYLWEDAANLSTSTRIPIVALDPELYDWEPGESLFDFLRPFLEASGLRLWCDEQRVWRLDVPGATDFGNIVEAFATGTYAPTSVGNAVDGRDVISRDRDDWATGVVVRYSYIGPDGRRSTKYDAAGTPGKVITIDRASAYPGPGAAAVILDAISQRGRTQAATITRGFQASPGYYSRVTLPGTAQQDGRVRRVVLDLATGNAEISTNGTETP